MLEPNLPGYLPDERLVVRKCVGMHQTHGHAPNPRVKHPLQLLSHRLPRRTPQHPHRLARQPHHQLRLPGLGTPNFHIHLSHRPLRILGIILQRDPLVHLDHARVQHLWLPDGQVENPRPRLVPNDETVAKPFCDNQRNSLALALEQRVGRDGGAHADGIDAGRVQGLAAGNVAGQEVRHDAADPLERRVAIVGRVLGQELDDDVLAVEVADAIGEGTAAVDGNADAPLFRGV